MAYTTINKSSEHFNTKLFTGNGSTNAVTGVGFQPDFVWLKNRNTTANHHLYDAVRGATKQITSVDTRAESTQTNGLTAFGSDGFTVGIDGDINGSGNGIASWNWKAGTTSGISAGSQTITPTAYSINTTAGFGIYKYTGNGTAGATISHGLGVKPDQVWIKKLSQADSWRCYNVGYNSGQQYFELDSVYGYGESAAVFNGTIPTSTTVTLGYQGHVNASGEQHIMYVFAPKVGFSKMGRYYGNGSTDGAFVYCGFKPAFVMIKRGDSQSDWVIQDNKRDGYNYNNHRLFPNTNATEESTVRMDLVSNGFKFRDGDGNGSGQNFIYYAVGQSIVGSNNIPATAR
tara:strand:+ start:63 stop:1094 length:1032 start_codon:yes stop_codon:yes gene_type:complete